MNAYKYNIHPLFTPEYYSSNVINPEVRSLCIYSNPIQSPQVISYEPYSLMQTYFYNKDYKGISFNDDFILYISIQDQLTHKNPNVLVTTYLRNYSLCNYGNIFPEAIMGDVLLFGAKNTSYKKINLQHYSIPYNLVEEIMTIYEKLSHT